MSTDDDRQIWVFDPKSLFANVENGEDGRPILVIRDSHSMIQIPAAGRDDAYALAAARRIGQTVWDYVLAVKTRGPDASGNGGTTEVDALRQVAGNSGPGWPIPGTQKGSST